MDCSQKSWWVELISVTVIFSPNLAFQVDIRLPREGEYALNLFADDEKAEGDVPNVVNYLIRCENDGEPIKTQAYPKLHDGILGKGQYEERMEVRPVSHRGGRIKTDDGHISASFEVY